MPHRGSRHRPRNSTKGLRRFVFQTFGRARKTQDNPIVPDVWLRYIRLAEDTARANASKAAKSDQLIDLLLTPWSGTAPPDIAKLLREGLQPPPGETTLKNAHIAQSTSRVVAKIDFITLVRVVMPLTAWWQGLYRNLPEFRKTSRGSPAGSIWRRA